MKLTIRRQDPASGEPPHDETYEVPEYEGMTALDAVMWVREHVDPTIACRFACRSANACKECLAVVNGERTYTCTFPVQDEIRLEPLPNKPLLRDLAVRL